MRTKRMWTTINPQGRADVYNLRDYKGEAGDDRMDGDRVIRVTVSWEVPAKPKRRKPTPPAL